MPRTLISSRLKAEERSTEKQDNHIEAALFAIEIIQSLLFKSSVRHRLDSITFQTILSEFRQWAHFSSSIYSAIRKTEIALLTQVTRLAIEPHCLLERLSPWGYDDDDDDDDDDENQRKLTVTLVEILVLRVADSLQEIFSQASAVRFAILSTETAKRWVLFSPTRFWTQERVNALDKLVGQRHSSIIEDNCRTFLEKLTDKRMESNIWGFNLEDARILLENDKLIEALWRGASRTPVNFRFLKSFRKLKASIDQVRQTPLDAPSWLASAQADASPTTGTGAKPPPPSFPTILIQPESYCAEHASDTLNATCTLASPNLPVAAKRPDLT